MLRFPPGLKAFLLPQSHAAGIRKEKNTFIGIVSVNF